MRHTLLKKDIILSYVLHILRSSLAGLPPLSSIKLKTNLPIFIISCVLIFLVLLYTYYLLIITLLTYQN